jgi:K(+)-stimulated pyrophosphate-energized sodium pump
MLGGYMAGVTVSGVLWAIFQNNAGGAWDNAKKSFEAGVEINGEMTFKGSDAHKASVTGDTVGDPFKDTSGPSMNILIKLTCLIGLVIAPILGGHGTHETEEISTNYIYDATYLDTFEMGNDERVLIVQSMVRDLIAKDYAKVSEYLSEDVVFNVSDGSSIEGKEAALKHITETYSEVDIQDYNVAVNLAVTGDNGDEWVLLWDNGKVVAADGNVTSLNWMESFSFDGDKFSFINQYSKSRN